MLGQVDITFLPKLNHTTNFKAHSLISALDEIAGDKYASEINRLRLLNLDEYKEQKKKLPAFCFNGTFNGILTNDNFKQSSELFSFDIDGLGAATIEADKAKIASIPSTVFCFVSPSGKGLKGALRIAPDTIKSDADFKQVYPQVEAMFAKAGFKLDKACKDVRRICFVSHDPKLYSNYDAEIYSVSAPLQTKQDPAKPPRKIKQQSINFSNELLCIDLCTAILQNASAGNRHEARLRAGKLAGGYIAAGQVDEQKLTDILLSASDGISKGGMTSASERKTIFEAINKGKLSPLDKPAYSVEMDFEAMLTNQKQRKEQSNQNTDQNSATSDFSEESESEPPFKRVSLADALSNPPEQQRYIWGERIPADELTLLAAHGGTGKSLLALQLGAHTSTGNLFLGLATEQVKTLFFSAEDATNTIRRRIGAICKADALDLAQVAENLIVLDATETPCLFHEVSDKGVRRGEITRYYSELKKIILDEGIRFLIVDNASDTFGANPIDRQAVTKFIRALVGLVRNAGGAVLLLSHVNKNTSKAGKNQSDTEGYADSAAWHNAARSRLFLNAIDELGNLSLTHQKNNLGTKQPVLNIAFRDEGSSLYAADSDQLIEAGAGKALVTSMMRNLHKKPILKLIHEFYCREEWISPSPNSAQTNAFALLKNEADFPLSTKHADKAECLAIVRELERDSFLIKETYKKLDRHDGQRWALTDAGLTFIDEPLPDRITVETLEPAELIPDENIEIL